MSDSTDDIDRLRAATLSAISKWDRLDYLFSALIGGSLALFGGWMLFLVFTNTPTPKMVVVDAPSFKGEATLLGRSSNTITVEIDGKRRVFSGTFSYEYQDANQ